MSAREEIARGLVGCGLRDRDLEIWADEVLTQLAFAGYRLLAPGELDAETVERCAEEATRHPGSAFVNHHGHMDWAPSTKHDIATAIRALSQQEHSNG